MDARRHAAKHPRNRIFYTTLDSPDSVDHKSSKYQPLSLAQIAIHLNRKSQAARRRNGKR